MKTEIVILSILAAPAVIGFISGMLDFKNAPTVTRVWCTSPVRQNKEGFFNSEHEIDVSPLQKAEVPFVSSQKIEYEASMPSQEMMSSINDLFEAIKDPEESNTSTTTSEPIDGSEENELGVSEAPESALGEQPGDYSELNGVFPPANELEGFLVASQADAGETDNSTLSLSQFLAEPEAAATTEVELGIPTADSVAIEETMDTSEPSTIEFVTESEAPAIAEEVAIVEMTHPTAEQSELSAEMAEVIEHEFINSQSIDEFLDTYEKSSTEYSNVIQFPFSMEAPMAIPLRDFNQIQRKYGEVVAQKITTTPAIGSTGMCDTMIGRIKVYEGKVVLSYRDTIVALSNFPKGYEDQVMLVTGSFVVPDVFAVEQHETPAAYMHYAYEAAEG